MLLRFITGLWLGLPSLLSPPFPPLLPASPETRNPAADRAAQNDADGNAHKKAANNLLAVRPASDELQDPVADIEVAEPVWR